MKYFQVEDDKLKRHDFIDPINYYLPEGFQLRMWLGSYISCDKPLYILFFLLSNTASKLSSGHKIP
jgi:hypothetical protein